jgi:hypothetical protein
MSRYEKIFHALVNAKVQFLVVGGVAVNLHGFYRATGDADIILLLKDSNIRKFISAVKKLKLKPRIPVNLDDFAVDKIRQEWIEKKGMKAFALFNPDSWEKELDVVIEHPVNFQRAYKKRSMIKDGPLEVPVISITDLIAMKEHADRGRDQIDIMALKQILEIRNASKKS